MRTTHNAIVRAALVEEEVHALRRIRAEVRRRFAAATDKLADLEGDLVILEAEGQRERIVVTAVVLGLALLAMVAFLVGVTT